MKIESNGPIRSTTGQAARRGAAAPAGRFSIDTGASTTGAALSGTAPLASVSALLALQGAEDATQGRSRGLNRGRSLLDRLDEIRLGLLTEGIPRHTLRALAAELRRTRGEGTDPKLDDVIAEIELRALVELAKFDDDTGPQR